MNKWILGGTALTAAFLLAVIPMTGFAIFGSFADGCLFTSRGIQLLLPMITLPVPIAGAVGLCHIWVGCKKRNKQHIFSAFSLPFIAFGFWNLAIYFLC